MVVEAPSVRAFIRLSPNEEEADRVQRLRASARQRVAQARQAANVRGRATSRAARVRGQAERGAKNVLMLEESQGEKKAALLKMQGALEALREEMGEAHARSSMQRALTARAREEDAIRTTVRESRAALRYKLAELTVSEQQYKLGAAARDAERRRDKSAVQRQEDRKSAQQYREDVSRRRGTTEAAQSSREKDRWRGPASVGASRPVRVEDYLHTRMHVQHRPLCFRYVDDGDEPATSLAEAAAARTARAKEEAEARKAVLDMHALQRFETALAEERQLISQQEMESTLEKCARFERVTKSKMYANDIARLTRDMRTAKDTKGGIDDEMTRKNASLNVDAARRNNVDAAFIRIFGVEQNAVPVQFGTSDGDTSTGARQESDEEAVRIPTSSFRSDRYARPGSSSIELEEDTGEYVMKGMERGVTEDDYSRDAVLGARSGGTVPSPYPYPATTGRRQPPTFVQQQQQQHRRQQEREKEKTALPVQITKLSRNETDEESRNKLLRLSNSSVASSALSSMLSKMSLDDMDALSSRGLDLSVHRQSSELDGFDIDDMSDSILGSALEDPLKELTALDTILHDLSSEVKESHRSLVEMTMLPTTDSTAGTGTSTTATTAISAARDDVSLTSSSSLSSDGDEYDYM